MPSPITPLPCACGQSALQVLGTPIISTECLCTDCQNAGAFLQSLPGAKPVLDHHGATRFVLYRKDRVCCVNGAELLRAHRLSKNASTRRVVARCCNTPMFLDFSGGHWLSIYGGIWPAGSLPPLEIRTMTRSKPRGVVLPPDVPNPGTHNWAFYLSLFLAWVDMGFRVPKVDFVHGDLDAQ